MELIYEFKKGAKIHIKEKNKGSFTKWCGGNVTNECIQRGKNSSNPKIRKKATFADNARHWKHKDGGILKGLGGLKTLIQINENQQRNSPFTYTLIQRQFVPKTGDTHETELFPGKEVVVRGTDRSKQERPYFVSSLTKLLQPSEAMYPLGVLAKPLTYIPGFNYVAPALSAGNYAAALTQGSLNPYKGAEIRANDERLMGAWLPLDFAGPVMLGKGILATGKFAVESAARAGNNTARAYLISREINLAIKNKPNISNRTISVRRSNNKITGQPDLIYTLYNEFGEPIGLTNIGGAVFGSGNKTHRMVDGVMSMRNAHKVSEDTYNAAVQDIIDNGGKGLESGWSLMMPLKTLAVTSKFPHTVIGLEFGNPVRLLTGTSKRPTPQRVLGNHYLELKPSFEIKYNESTGNFEQIPISNSEPYVSTSLKFFERRPSRISLAERVGVPKGERDVWNPQVMLNAKEFANKYGYEVPLTIEEAKNMYRQHNRFFRSVNTDRYEPKTGNTFFEYAPNYKPGMSEKEVIYGLYPEFKELTPQQLRFTLASRGYPLYDRTYKISDIGKGPLDDFVFVSPSLAENVQYANSTGDNFSNTVMLLRPFSFGKPSEWHINADWRPTEKVYGTRHNKGLVSEGNASLKYEGKISTKHLIPVKIAEKGDLGTFLGDYLEKQKYKGSLPYEIIIPINKQGGKMKRFQLGGFVNPAMAAIPYMNPNSMGGSIVQGYFNNLLNLDLILQMQQQKKLAELEEKKLKAERLNLMFNKVLDIGSNLLTNYLNNKLNLTMSNLNLAIS